MRMDYQGDNNNVFASTLKVEIGSNADVGSSIKITSGSIAKHLAIQTHYSIIMVTHNMQQAARVSDKTAFFLNGYVNEYDDTMIE
jgi:ABC-type phosphate transport system ATPase subunit